MISEVGNNCGNTLISIWHVLSCPWSEPATAADIIIFCVFISSPNSHAFSFCHHLQNATPHFCLYSSSCSAPFRWTRHSFNYVVVPLSSHNETVCNCHVCVCYCQHPIHWTSIPVLERVYKCVLTSRAHQSDERICDAERGCAFPVVLRESGAPHHWHAHYACHLNAHTIQSTSWTHFLETPPPTHSLFMHFSLFTQKQQAWRADVHWSER